MSTQGVGTYAINSFWESGRLIYYEKASGHTTTGNVFILGADYVQVGDTANDVNFVWKGDTTGTFTLDAGGHTLALTGLATSTDGAVTITNATATSSTTTGALIVTGGIATAADITCGDDLFMSSAGVINFNAGDVTITHASNLLTIAGGGLTIGASGTPAGDFTLYGTQATLKVWFDVDGDTNGAFYFGADDYGLDVGFYGQTASNSMVWDASANALVFTAGGITMGVTSKLVIPVKASGSTTNGDIWVDTTDNLIHYYTNSYEYTVTAT